MRLIKLFFLVKRGSVGQDIPYIHLIYNFMIWFSSILIPNLSIFYLQINFCLAAKTVCSKLIKKVKLFLIKLEMITLKTNKKGEK